MEEYHGSLPIADARAHELALAVDALRSAQEEYATVKAEFKERFQRIHENISRLSNEILTGQRPLPLEPAEEQPLEIVGP